MNTAEFARTVYSMVNTGARTEGQQIDFEMAYQARVASDRIRFAIRQIDITSNQSDELREVSMQLLDALDRLECAERRFQTVSRTAHAQQDFPR
jgi:hypothetical protein